MTTPVRTSALLFRNAQTNSHLSKLRNRFSEVGDKAVTGLDVQTASDAPSKWPSILDLGASIDDQSVYGANADRATSLLGVAETALRDATTAMKRGRELAVRFSNGSMNADDRAMAAVEVRGLRDTLIDLGNIELGGRFLFAGTAYDEAAFDAAGTYQGTTDVPEIVIGDQDRITAGFDGQVVFGSSLQALEDLAVALETGTEFDVNAQLGAVDQATRDMIEARSVAGVAYTRAEDTKMLTESLSIVMNEALRDDVAADPFETFQHFTELSNHLEATLALTARSNSLQGLMERI